MLVARQCPQSQEKQALKSVRVQRHLPLTIQFYMSCRIIGVPPLQSDFSGLSSARWLESRDLWKQQIENIHLISSSKHDLPGSFGDLSRPVSLSLSKHARKFKKRKKRKKNGEKKRALIKTRIYNYYVPYATYTYERHAL